MGIGGRTTCYRGKKSLNDFVFLADRHDEEGAARMQTTERIGERIAELRGEMSQQDLAQAVGIDPTVLSKIEAGKRPLRINELVAMARELGVDPAVLLDEERAVFSLRGDASAQVREAVQQCEHIVDAYLTLSALAGDR